MSTSYTYKYPRPMVTVDLVVFALSPDGLRTLLIRRKKDPFVGQWAIPGGYLEMDEPIEAGARRELREETGLDELVFVEQIGVFGEPGRDPRGRTISIAHAGLVKGPSPRVKGSDDAEGAAWLDPATTTGLAFDHDAILTKARWWLSRTILKDRILCALLPDVFTARNVDAVLGAGGVVGKWSPQWIPRALRLGTIERVSAHARSYREVREPQ